MRKLAERYPLLFAVVAIVVYDLAMNALSAALRRTGLSDLGVSLVTQAVFCGYVAALLGWLGWWRGAGFTKRVTWRAVLVYSPWIFLPLLMVAGSDAPAIGALHVAAYALFALMVGFAEEGLLRGVVLRALLPRGALGAAVVSSLLFGIAHLSNIAEGRDTVATIVQAIYATLIGIGFAGPRLYTGTIWPAVGLHGLIDFADFASRDFASSKEVATPTLGQAILVIAITGAYALYGLWLVRRHRRKWVSEQSPRGACEA